MLLYSSVLLFLLVAGLPYWAFRMATSGRYRAGLRGRLGRVPAGLRQMVSRRAGVVWVHAVSVGEVLAATRLVAELREAIRSRFGPGWVIVVSTTTETGQRLARERFGEDAVFYLPLDFRLTVGRYLRVLQPRLLLLMESELWPRLLAECGRVGVPVAVANARVSDRSFPRYMRLRRLWRPLLGRVALFLAGGEESAGRLRRIGVAADRVRVTGNLKFDVRPAGDGPNARVEAVGRRLAPEAAAVVCGSTLEGEESRLLDLWPEVLRAEPQAVMVLAPRHPDRFERVAGLVRERGLPLLRASAMDAAEAGLEAPGTITAGSVVLLDTIGDLAAMYGLAAVAFVGGSLVEAGGHNPLEPASLGRPVVIGSSYANFREIVEAMRANDGIRVVTGAEMASALLALLRDRDAAEAMGRRGGEVFRSQAGGTARTVAALMELLGDGAGLSHLGGISAIARGGASGDPVAEGRERAVAVSAP